MGYPNGADEKFCNGPDFRPLVEKLRKDVEAGPFTARDPVLGRQLYKGRSV